MKIKKLHALLASAGAALLLAACGGGGDDIAPKAAISRVVVAGDSLADVGTFFGRKFTVQNAANAAAGYPIYPELVARNYGITSLCPFFSFNGTTFVPAATAACSDFAIGNSRIQNTAAQGGAAGPQSIPLQLATAASVQPGGTFTARDLIVVEGGGNDFDDLFHAYAGGAGTYVPFLSTLIDGTTLNTVLAAPNGSVNAGALYMQKLADQYYNAIATSLLANGATHVAVLNMPDVTVTPSFGAAMAQASANAGGGTAGATAAAQLQALGRAWISAFNTELQAKVGGDGRIAVVPFYADIQDEVTNAANYGLTNAAQPACIVALNTDTTSGACTDNALDAAPPAGLAAGWWRTWAFADGLHPTPLGHQLLGASVSRALARAGWI